MSNLQQLITPDTNWVINYNTPIIKQTSNDLATDTTEAVLLAIDEETAIKKWNDWENRHILKKGEIRVADGTLTSTFMVPLKEFSNGYETILDRVSDLISKSKNFKIHLEEDPNVREVQSLGTELGNKLQTLCSNKDHTRDRRFAGIILFALASIITIGGITSALTSSSRLVSKEDISKGIDVSKEKLHLEQLEITRSHKDYKRITALDDRYFALAHNNAIDEFVQVLKQTAENQNRELDFITNPGSYNFAPSLFMERIASDILNFFSNNSNDLFDHVLGTGITEMHYFTTFNTIIIQSDSSNSCEDAHALVVANTIIPNNNVVGYPTQDPQKFQTNDGRIIYIAKQSIATGSKFRPANSLSSQRMIISSPSISVTVLNNTVFAIENNGIHLDIVIECPDKPLVQETLYNSPFLRLHTSCKLRSEHLNISTYTRDYIHDDIIVKLNIYDMEDEEKDFNIGYHKTPIENRHDITEMFEMADDIFKKETEILQHEMKRLENNPSIGRMFEKIGSTVSGWFSTALHKIVGIIAVIVAGISGLLLLVIVFKCSTSCRGAKNI